MSKAIQAKSIPFSPLQRLAELIERLVTRVPATIPPRRPLEGACTVAEGEQQARASGPESGAGAQETGAAGEGDAAQPPVVIEPWRAALLERERAWQLTCLRLRESLQRFRQTPGHTEEQIRKVETAYAQYMSDPGDFFRLNNIGLNFTPDELPPCKGIDLCGNRLVSLPANWPATIRNIFASDNLFETWPIPPDADMKWIILKGCRLVEIPPLREGLLRLVVSENRIARIPTQIPDSLLRFDLKSNRLVDLPQAVVDSLYRANRIDYDFTSNPLSDEARIALTDAGHYSVPFSVPRRANASTIVPHASGIDLAPVKHWYQPDAEDLFAADGWEQRLRAPEAKDFSQMLSRLRGAVPDIEALDQLQFKLDLRAWLRALAEPENQELRLLAYGMAKDALTSCDDRLVFAYAAMRAAMVTHEVQSGGYDGDAGALVERARGIFRLAELDEIAKASVTRQKNADPVEVFLAYRVRLRERLGLPLPEIGMRFPGLAGLTDEDLDRAQASVLQAEAARFVDFLCRWEPWQAAVGRMMPEALQAERERMLEALPIEVNARLAADQLEGLEAEARMGKVVADQLGAEIYRRLTLSLLDMHNIAIAASQ